MIEKIRAGKIASRIFSNKKGCCPECGSERISKKYVCEDWVCSDCMNVFGEPHTFWDEGEINPLSEYVSVESILLWIEHNELTYGKLGLGIYRLKRELKQWKKEQKEKEDD
jgi:hypothetical protein